MTLTQVFVKNCDRWHFTFISTPQLLSLSKTDLFDQDRVPKFRNPNIYFYRNEMYPKHRHKSLWIHAHIPWRTRHTQRQTHAPHTHSAHTHHTRANTHAQIRTHAHTHTQIYTIHSSKSSSFLIPFLSVICAFFLEERNDRRLVAAVTCTSHNSDPPSWSVPVVFISSGSSCPSSPMYASSDSCWGNIPSCPPLHPPSTSSPVFCWCSSRLSTVEALPSPASSLIVTKGCCRGNCCGNDGRGAIGIVSTRGYNYVCRNEEQSIVCIK